MICPRLSWVAVQVLRTLIGTETLTGNFPTLGTLEHSVSWACLAYTQHFCVNIAFNSRVPWTLLELLTGPGHWPRHGVECAWMLVVSALVGALSAEGDPAGQQQPHRGPRVAFAHCCFGGLKGEDPSANTCRSPAVCQAPCDDARWSQLSRSPGLARERQVLWVLPAVEALGTHAGRVRRRAWGSRRREDRPAGVSETQCSLGGWGTGWDGSGEGPEPGGGGRLLRGLSVVSSYVAPVMRLTKDEGAPSRMFCFCVKFTFCAQPSVLGTADTS